MEDRFEDLNRFYEKDYVENAKHLNYGQDPQYLLMLVKK
jgi:hypothetical protein